MPLMKISISSVMAGCFTPVVAEELPNAEVIKTKGPTGEFACDDYDLLLQALEKQDPDAHAVVNNLINRAVSRQSKTIDNHLIVDCIEKALIVNGGLHKEPYAYDVDGFWKRVP